MHKYLENLVSVFVWVILLLTVINSTHAQLIWTSPGSNLTVSGGGNYTDAQARAAINNTGIWNFLGVNVSGTIRGYSATDFVFSLERETATKTFTSAAKLVTSVNSGASTGSGGGLLFAYRNLTEADNSERFLGSLGAQVFSNATSGAFVINTYKDGVFQNNMYLTADKKVGIDMFPPTGVVSIINRGNSPENASMDKYAIVMANPSSTNGLFTGECYRVSSDTTGGKTCGAAIIHERSGSNDIGHLWFETSSGSGENLTIKGGFTSGGAFCVGTRSNCLAATSGLVVSGPSNVSGPVQLGSNPSTNCSLSTEGAITYNSTNHEFLGCNSTNWRVLS